ncbi:flagellar protein FlaG [Pyrinomonas methylaliphatogenes]|uniref:Flagellar protein FlaG n=1 Tax=Pyrinomonas methylaliphatogenes TaxID=454194 RepID=A0A0B6WXL8_9BACT|nr:flagellar protein FlaG [Pyrinomonas methylaliphatogenes]CDM64920.1 flagellar protein FlaG [Pyrinomonas methylaliphatogenes]
MAITGTSLAVSTSYHGNGANLAGTAQAALSSPPQSSKIASPIRNELPAPEGDWRKLEKLADLLQPFQIALKFSRDDETGAIVIQVFDERTGEMLRQIPPEAMLRLSAELGKLQGQVFNRRA